MLGPSDRGGVGLLGWGGVRGWAPEKLRAQKAERIPR